MHEDGEMLKQTRSPSLSCLFQMLHDHGSKVLSRYKNDLEISRSEMC